MGEEASDLQTDEQFVIIGLTKREAGALYEIMGAITGDPNGPRGIARQIRGLLLEAGVPDTLYEYKTNRDLNNINMRDKWPDGR